MRVAIVVAVACLSAAGLCAEQDVQASMKKSTNIPAQELVPALKTLARERGFHVVFLTEVVGNRHTPGAVGDFTTTEALTRLLEGTHLGYSYLDEKTVTIVPVNSNSKLCAEAPAAGNLQRCCALFSDKLDSTTSPNQAGSGSTAINLTGSEGASDCVASYSQENQALATRIAGAADAPVQNSDAESDKEATKSDALQEIVVTAQKRTERLQDVPMSISALSNDTLQALNIKSATDLAFAVPGLGAYQVSPGQNLLEIRGVSGFRGTGSLVGLYMDDTPLSGGIRLGDGSGLDVQTIDLARVEVLKGPQGTLFGEGGAGGVIRYVTNDPKLDIFEGRVAATYFGTESGSDSGGGTGVLNVPIVKDLLAVRLVGTYEYDGGWIDNTSNEKSDFNNDRVKELRGKVLYAPMAELKISGLIDLHRLDFGGQNIVNVPPYSSSLFQQAVYPNYPTAGYNNFDLYNLTGSYDFGFATLLSSTSHFVLKASSGAFGGGWQTQIIPGAGVAPLGGWQFLEGYGRAQQTMTSEEVRLTSDPGGPVKWLIGGDYKRTFNKQFANDPTNIGLNVFIPGMPPTIIPGARQDFTNELSRIFAAYADGSYTFLDRLELGGGLRYFHESQATFSYQPDGAPLTNPGTGGAALGTSSGNVSGTFGKTTYRVFADYKIEENLRVYANTGTGFRSGGFNEYSSVQQGAPLTYNPENSVFYEVGLKSALLDGRLDANLAGFAGQYKDQVQLGIQINPTTGGVVSFYENAGAADIKGVEWNISAAPVRGLRIGFDGDFMKTDFVKVAAKTTVAVGDPLDFVPKYDFLLSASYAFKWTNEVGGYVNLSSSWQGAMQNTNRGTGIGFVINRNAPLNFINASIGAMYGGFDVSLFARNLADERGILIPQFSGLTPQARPRSFGVTIGKSF